MSFINVDIPLDRNEVIALADGLADKFEWETDDYRRTIFFSTDHDVQFYIELEGGGKAEFNRLIKEKHYYPFQWKVRFYKEFETAETDVYFTPIGIPFGFQEKFPETYFLPSLSPDSARIIAETGSTENWNIDLKKFELIEEKKNQVASGRIDHTFIYKKNDFSYGEAEYRISLTVSGNRFSGLLQNLKLPEAFYRRYKEMRSANETIATTATISIAVFYGMLGIVVGLFFLLKTHSLLWKQGLIWGGIISLLSFISGFNYFPLSWMWYDTAISQNSFVIHQIIQQFINSLLDFLLISTTFMVAEGLTRKAFPNHVQLWKTWDKDTGSSLRILGNTIGGYFTAVIDILFILIFYLITERYLKWWNPASLSTNPNSIATAFPWFSAIADSLHAGFWEECLFRAIPIAGAIVLGEKYNRRTLFFVSALILQALIFGAGHANYAAQPAYARVIELILPSLYFAYLYIRFGLLTAIITHFAVDAILMSMPLWVTNYEGIWIQRMLFLLLFLLPVLIVILLRLKAKKWNEVPEESLNKNWLPKIRMTFNKNISIEHKIRFKQHRLKYLIVSGIAGFLVLLFLGKFTIITDPVTVDKKDIETFAHEYLKEQGIKLSSDWNKNISFEITAGQADKYIWREWGRDVYRKLVGSYLTPTKWQVRFTNPKATVEERAEEYNFFFRNDGKLTGFKHNLPEELEGVFLEQKEAEKLCHDFVETWFNITLSEYKELSIEAVMRPARRDWIFVYADTLSELTFDNQLQVKICIAGDKVISYEKFIKTPELWQREYTNTSKSANIIKSLMSVIFMLIFFALLIAGVILGHTQKISGENFLTIFAILVILQSFVFLISFETSTADFSTSEPYNSQLFRLIIASVLKIIFSSLVIGLIHAFNKNYFSTNKGLSGIQRKQNISVAIFSALFIAGCISLFKFLKPEMLPALGGVNGIDSSAPILFIIADSLVLFLTISAVIQLFFISLELISGYFAGGRVLRYLLTGILSITFFANFLEIMDFTGIFFWLISAFISILIFTLYFEKVLRYFLPQISLVIAIVISVELIIKIFQKSYNAFLPAAVVSILLIVASGFFLSEKYIKNNYNEEES